MFKFIKLLQISGRIVDNSMGSVSLIIAAFSILTKMRFQSKHLRTSRMEVK